MKKEYIYVIGAGLLFFVLLFSGLLPFSFNKNGNECRGTSCQPAQLTITAKNNGLGSAIYIEWNPVTPKPSSYALARANVEGNSLSSFKNIPTVSNAGGDFAIDYDVERGVTYEYRVIPIYGSSFDLDGIDKVSGTRITADFVETKSEKILFVMPDKYLETRKDLSQVLSSFVDGINFVYSGTKKIFSFAGLKTYNPDTCVNGCANIIADSQYYTPGALVVYGIPGAITSAYTVQGAPPTIFLGNESLHLADSSNDLSPNSGFYSLLVQTLSHEVAHTYGVAIPEYYVYPNAIDNSNISPKIPVVSLSEEYLRDIMLTYQDGFRKAAFGPLSIYIINENLYHSDMRFRSRGISDMNQLYPSKITVKVNDSLSRAIISSKIDVFCIQAEDPRYQGLHQQPSLIKSLSTDAFGMASFSLENKIKRSMSEAKCHVLGFKVFKDGLVSSSNYVTELQLQGEKLLRKSDEFSIRFILKSN